MNSNNKILKQKWIYLEKLLSKNQMLALDYKKRPTCAHILSSSELWSISKSELQSNDLTEECGHQFIKSYLKFKINERNIRMRSIFTSIGSTNHS